MLDVSDIDSLGKTRVVEVGVGEERREMWGDEENGGSI